MLSIDRAATGGRGGESKEDTFGRRHSNAMADEEREDLFMSRMDSMHRGGDLSRVRVPDGEIDAACAAAAADDSACACAAAAEQCAMSNEQ